jgi:hypothetical protein
MSRENGLQFALALYGHASKDNANHACFDECLIPAVASIRFHFVHRRKEERKKDRDRICASLKGNCNLPYLESRAMKQVSEFKTGNISMDRLKALSSSFSSRITRGCGSKNGRRPPPLPHKTVTADSRKKREPRKFEKLDLIPGRHYLSRLIYSLSSRAAALLSRTPTCPFSSGRRSLI